LVRVKSIDACRSLRCRLEGLGILAGQEIRVLKNRRGPVLLEVYGRKVGLGRGQAQKIIVEETKPLF